MRIYRRADGFEVQDSENRDLWWVTENYGPGFVEVLPKVPTLEEQNAEMVKAEIALLESTITVRRLREAVLGVDGGWLASVEAEISRLRSTL